MSSSPWIARGVLIAVFVFVAWQCLVARSAESVAWARANELRSAAGCAAYLEWASEALEPTRKGVLVKARSYVMAWVSEIESHQRVAKKCPPSVADAWTR